MTGDALGAHLRAAQQRSEQATQLYIALTTTGRLHEFLRLTYRCPNRCALLHLVDTPDGLLVGFPRFKTSPTETERTSNESGRAKNTEDGHRRWRQHAAYIETVSRPPLSCDDLHNVPLEDDALTADLDAGHTEVIVRPDGTRYAVR